MKKLFKTMFFITLTLILLLVTFIAVSAASAENNNSSSISIIGGADGPTAIFITQTLVFQNPVFWLLCVATVLFVVSAIGWFITRKRNN